jgi:hypothetical protein
LEKSVIRDKFGYEIIKFSLPNSNSYFEFLYTPQVRNFEKTKYYVNSLEELYVFVKEFIRMGGQLGIRYCEAFISAYNPTHQQIFHNAGLFPRGYVPSWEFNKEEKVFEDRILFNWFEGKIDRNIQLIDEGKELLTCLSLNNSEGVNEFLEEKKLLDDFPILYNLKEKASRIWDYPKVIKFSLMTGLILYLVMLIGSIVISKLFGYSIISHTISHLGTTAITPVPFMFDTACVIGGMTTTLLYCYLSRLIKTKNTRPLIKKIAQYASGIGIIGSIGIIFVGFFSFDRSGPRGLFHILSSLFAFGGFISALFAFGILICRTKAIMPKIIGVNGIVPLLILIIYCIFPIPLLEWMLLFSILTSLIPLFLWISFR